MKESNLAGSYFLCYKLTFVVKMEYWWPWEMALKDHEYNLVIDIKQSKPQCSWLIYYIK